MDKGRIKSASILDSSFGIVFFTVFSAAYYLTIPSRQILIAQPVFHALLQIFGVLFFAATIIVLVLSALAKPVE